MESITDTACNSNCISCPVVGCSKVLQSAPILKLHMIYFHKMKQDEPILKVISKRSRKIKATSSQEKADTRQYFCPEEKCEHNSQKRAFNTLQHLKQHYIVMHSEKNFECQNCEKKFATLGDKMKHESACGVKYVCSCGAAYYGKRGILSHVKRSSHPLPNAFKDMFAPKKKVQQKRKVIFAKHRKTLAPILPKAISLMKWPILYPADKFKSHQSKNVTIFPKGLCVPEPSSASKKFTVSIVSANAIVPCAAVTRTPETNINQQDALSIAVQVSGIKYPNDIIKTSDSCMQTSVSSPSFPYVESKMSQTESRTKAMVAQDSSCQTEEFLEWLDRESCNVNNRVFSSVNEAYPSHMSTQTLNSISNNFVHYDSNRICLPQPSTAQIETQTEDWLSDLFYDQGLMGGTVSNAESQTYPMSLPEKPMNVLNQNNNSNVEILEDPPLIPDLNDNLCAGINVQDALFFTDSATLTEETCTTNTPTSNGLYATVMTQTNGMPKFCDASMSTSFLDFLNHTQTQTDNSCPQGSSTSAHTQTMPYAYNGTNLLSDLLNIQTQTESELHNPIEVMVAETQTLFDIPL